MRAIAALPLLLAPAFAAGRPAPHQVLAFYYGWYGNPETSGKWVHWNLGRPGPRPITDRYAGETYRTLWEEAIAAQPDWILITSWNEWHEGSEIEPSWENGVRELQTTKEFAPMFLR